MNSEEARKLAERWARQDQGFDPKKFNDHTTLKAAEAEYKRIQDQLRRNK